MRGHCISCGAPYQNYTEKENFIPKEKYDFSEKHAIIVQKSMESRNRVNYNKSFVCYEKDLDNGSIVQLNYQKVNNNLYEAIIDKMIFIIYG